MNIRQNIKDLRNHADYSFKNKQNFRKKQKQVADAVIKLASIFYIVGVITVYLIAAFFKTFKITPIFLIVGLFSILFIAGIFFSVAITIKHPFLSYVLVIPLVDVVITYIIKQIGQLKSMLLCYIVICAITYIIFIFLLPINIFRKITPQLAFIPPIITIVSQTIIDCKDLLFNLMTDNISNKVENQLFNNNFLTIKNKKDFVEFVYKIYNYLLTNKESSLFYNQISAWISGVTLTFVIGGICITIRTHFLNSKANKKWKELVYSDCVQYQDLKMCAYIGGANYENLILNNPIFLNIIKNKEKIGDRR